MKRILRFVLVLALGLSLSVNSLRATEEKDETLGDKLKKLFVRPTPTPKPRKKKKTASPAHSTTPATSASETPAPSVSAAETAGSAPPEATETPTASATVTQTPTPSEKPATQYFDAVRPISPPTGRRATKARPRQTAPETGSTQFPTMTVFPEAAGETPASRPIPNLPPLDTSSELPPTTSASRASASQPPSPPPQKTPARETAAPLEQISESASYSPELRRIVELALDLAGRNLGYKYVSADPKNGGMDSSGFIYYVLTQSGVKNVPRDAREQYIWVRKAGNFQAVLAQRDDTFELDALKPGDLLFWASNYGISRDPDITQTMVYLGREKGSNQRLMVGASESPSSGAQKKSGVGVFEFKVVRPPRKSTEENGPVFVGYGQIPGLSTK